MELLKYKVPTMCTSYTLFGIESIENASIIIRNPNITHETFDSMILKLCERG